MIDQVRSHRKFVSPILLVLAIGLLIWVVWLTQRYNLHVQVQWSYSLSNEGHPNVAWSPDGKTIAVVDNTKLLLFPALDQTAKPRILVEPPTTLGAIAFSPNGTSLAVVENTSLVFYDTNSQQVTHTVQVLGESPISLGLIAFSPDGTLLAVENNQSLIVYDIHTEQVIQTIQGTSKDYHSFVFSPDGTILAVANDKVIQLWQIQPSVYLGDLEASSILGSIYSLAFHPDGKTLVSLDCPMCGPITDTLLWDMPSRSLKANLQTNGSVEGYILGAEFTYDGSLITLSGGCRIVSSDLQAKQWHELYRPTADDICSATFNQDGKYVYILGGDSNTITVLDVVHKETLGKVSMDVMDQSDGIEKADFSPDGKYIVSVSNKKLVVWKFR